MIWKDVPNLEQTHEICNYGIIRKKDTKTELKLRELVSLWCPIQKKRFGFTTNALLEVLFSPSERVHISFNTPSRVSTTELYTGEIEGEIWKQFGEHQVSNYGRVLNKKGRMLKPTKSGHQYVYGFGRKKRSIRKILLKLFKKSEIRYDVGIPPRKALISRLKSGKIGVYPAYGMGKKKWRYLIQYKNKQYAGYFHTKTQARINWVMKYSELHGLGLKTGEILEMI